MGSQKISDCSNSLNFEAEINFNTTRQNDLRKERERKQCTGLKFDLRKERDVSQGKARNDLLIVVMLNINSTRGKIWQDYDVAENVLSSSSSVALRQNLLVTVNINSLYLHNICILHRWRIHGCI